MPSTFLNANSFWENILVYEPFMVSLKSLPFAGRVLQENLNRFYKVKWFHTMNYYRADAKKICTCGQDISPKPSLEKNSTRIAVDAISSIPRVPPLFRCVFVLQFVVNHKCAHTHIHIYIYILFNINRVITIFSASEVS